MFTINELIAERDAVLMRARQLREYIDSAEFYAQDIKEPERYYVKQQEVALLEYHAGLINQIGVKQLPMQTA